MRAVATDWQAIVARLEALEQGTPADEAAQTAVRRRRAPAWLGWAAAAVGAAYAGYDQVAAREDRATAAAIERLDTKVEALDEKIDAIADDVLLLRAGAR